jgi:hypothetical protein
MIEPRAQPNVFLVNDSILVLSRESKNKSQSSQMIGERYILKENKWKPIEAKNQFTNSQISFNNKGHHSKSMNFQINSGPSALLYE